MLESTINIALQMMKQNRTLHSHLMVCLKFQHIRFPFNDNKFKPCICRQFNNFFRDSFSQSHHCTSIIQSWLSSGKNNDEIVFIVLVAAVFRGLLAFPFLILRRQNFCWICIFAKTAKVACVLKQILVSNFLDQMFAKDFIMFCHGNCLLDRYTYFITYFFFFTKNPTVQSKMNASLIPDQSI